MTMTSTLDDIWFAKCGYIPAGIPKDGLVVYAPLHERMSHCPTGQVINGTYTDNYNYSRIADRRCFLVRQTGKIIGIPLDNPVKQRTAVFFNYYYSGSYAYGNNQQFSMMPPSSSNIFTQVLRVTGNSTAYARRFAVLGWNNTTQANEYVYDLYVAPNVTGWHSYAMSTDSSGKMEAYMDGVHVWTYTHQVQDAVSLQLAFQNNGSTNYGLRDCLFYDTVLSQQQIQQIHNTLI